METPDYLAYKKAKNEIKDEHIKQIKNKNTERVKMVFIVFGLSFSLCFLFILNITGSLDAKVDIEKAHQGVEILDENGPIEQKGTIDRRLESIYNEEIGLSTARAVNKKGDEIMDPEKYKEIKSEQEEFQKERKLKDKIGNLEVDVEQNEEVQTPIFTRVLVGKYYTVEDAKGVQDTIRNLSGFETASPFIRKIGDFYTIQVGSYTNPNIARDIANRLNNEGYTVWILEN